MSRKICVVVTARPSFAKWQTVLEALRDRPDVELQIVVGCSALLERYGHVRAVIEAQGFPIATEAWTVLEGETLLTGARETGVALMEFASIFHRLQPDIVCAMADRREILAVAAAAKFQHIRLAHVQGGECSGSVDDAVRNAVTMLADVHFPATLRAAERVQVLTRGAVHLVGCPSIDMALRAQQEPPVTAKELGGAGADIDLSRPFGIVLQHPVTTQVSSAAVQMRQTLIACDTSSLQWIVFWPGEDAGAGAVSKAVRGYQPGIHTVRNLPPSRFLRLLTQASVLVGNSSAGIREGSALGVPVVNIGSRQQGRERGPNVLDAPHVGPVIAAMIRQQVAHGRYEPSSLYGTGDSGEKIAEVLCRE